MVSTAARSFMLHYVAKCGRSGNFIGVKLEVACYNMYHATSGTISRISDIVTLSETSELEVVIPIIIFLMGFHVFFIVNFDHSAIDRACALQTKLLWRNLLLRRRHDLLKDSRG